MSTPLLQLSLEDNLGSKGEALNIYQCRKNITFYLFKQINNDIEK